MNKSVKLSTMLEPEINESIKDLAQKKGMTASGLIRQLILDALKFHDLLPEELTFSILKNRSRV